VAAEKGAPKNVSSAALLAAFQKEHGESVGNFGGQMLDMTRLPTGIFKFDLASGGGLPRGKCSIIFGPESSGKTNTVLKAIAMHQFLFPHLVCVFIAIEGFDKDWAALLGVDVAKLIVLYPSFAEEVVDMAESFLHAADCGLVAIDSLAAMVTTQEGDSSAGKANVGGATLAIGKLVRKTSLALQEAAKSGRLATLLYVNQTRYKIGIMFGDPETMPGGMAPRFQAAMIVRLYGKNIMDPKISSTMPVIKKSSFIIRKWKVPIVAASGEYDMSMIHHKGLQPGECDDFNAIVQYLKDFGQMEKAPKGGWMILEEHYPTIDKFEYYLTTNPSYNVELRSAIIARVLEEGVVTKGGG